MAVNMGLEDSPAARADAAPSRMETPAPSRKTLHLELLRPAIQAPPPRPVYDALKAGGEWLFAGLCLVLAAPILLLIAVAVKLTSRGPVLYSQTRVGKNGKLFTLYKVRSMVHDCEKTSGVRWSTPGDSRITPIGAVLRKTHLDELPQLWNVLRGDMGLVGPRPERPEFMSVLERAIPHYRDRLSIRPGVTGLAQVQLPADTDMASVRRKLAYDLYYIRYRGFWLDLRLIACTAVHMAGVSYKALCLLFAMPRPEAVEVAYQEYGKVWPQFEA